MTIPPIDLRVRAHGLLLRLILIAFVLGAVAIPVIPMVRTLAVSPGNQSFLRTWQRPDQPVASGMISRTWMWGPDAFSQPLTEPYAEAPDGQRTVQYFDKSRMEITHPDANSSADWYVTNGLLVVELITGKRQTGDATFEQHAPAAANVAGDPDDPTGPTYRSFQLALDIPARGEGSAIVERIDRAGVIIEDASLASRNVAAERYVPETGHTVAGPFWTFMNSSGLVYRDDQYVSDTLFPNPFYATGYPITDAYWAEVKVAGVYQDVLMQCFERRCLTYTPDNEAGWQVEAGNVGQHYYAWRYGQHPGDKPTATATSTAPATTTATATPTTTATTTPPAATATATATTAPVTEYGFAAQWGEIYTPQVKLLRPFAVAIDAGGSIWVADFYNHQLVQFDQHGKFLRAVGSKGPGEGQLDGPIGVAVDDDGNVYVADYSNDRIQVFDGEGDFLAKWGVSGSDNGEFAYPTGIAIRSDLVYVTDRGNNRVQIFNLDGVYQGQFGSMGTGNGQFDGPYGVVLDAQGNVYVADNLNNRVQKFTSSGEYLDQFGSKGAGDGQFDGPSGLAIDAQGNIYVIDFYHNRIEIFSPDGNYLTQWGTTGRQLGQLLEPNGLAIDSHGDVYVADSSNERVQKFTADGAFLFAIYDGSRGQFGTVLDIAVDQNGNHLTVDTNKFNYDPGSISRFTPDGVPLDVLDWTRNDRGQYDQLSGVAVNLESGDIYVTDRVSNRVQRFSSTWQYRGAWGTSGAGPGQFNGPTAIEIDTDGSVYVADAGNNRIQKFDATGVFILQWGVEGAGNGQFVQPAGIAIDGERVYVSDSGNDRIQVFSRQGTYRGQWGGSGSGPGELKSPAGLAVNPDGVVLVVDSGNHRVQLFSPDGVRLGGFGALGSGLGEFNVPYGIALDAAGNIYVTDILNHRIQKFRPVN